MPSWLDGMNCADSYLRKEDEGYGSNLEKWFLGEIIENNLARNSS
jgi:hypothetical protein